MRCEQDKKEKLPEPRRIEDKEPRPPITWRFHDWASI